MRDSLGMSTIASARALLAGVFDIIVPQRCVLCGRHGAALCSCCMARHAGTPLVCRTATASLGVRALGTHDGLLRAAILGLKYRNQVHAAYELGALLGRKLGCGVDALVPVPLHPRRARARGYNQAEVIAHGLGSALEAPVIGDALERCTDTLPQSSLHLRDREHNVSHAFAAGPGIARLYGLDVLIVDDVITTGATIAACAAALRAAGAAVVGAAALALRR